MPKVHFVKNVASIDVENGQILMEALLQHHIPVASSCLGKGVCSKCKVQVVAGGAHLSPESQLEKDLREKNAIPEGWRISCQSQVRGDITVDTPYW